MENNEIDLSKCTQEQINELAKMAVIKDCTISELLTKCCCGKAN